MNKKILEDEICRAAIKATIFLPKPLEREIRKAADKAKGLEKKFLERIVSNISIASENLVPICQDTGIFEVWMDIGKKNPYRGVNFSEVVQKAISRAHGEGHLRKSMSQTKAVLHISYNNSSKIKCLLTPRGAGSENYTTFHMLEPEISEKQIFEIVVNDILLANARPCPPFVIGIAIGGTATAAMELSARALAEVDFKHSKTEEKLLEKINKEIPYGAGGVKGKFTALGVKIKEFPRHIAGFPLAMHIGCWANRVAGFKFPEGN